MITENDLICIGFKRVPTFTVMNSLTYDLGRNRFLSVGCLGTPNEVMFIGESCANNSMKITDLVCLHNYDYDGYMSTKKVNDIINALTKSK